jgi:hypothetical protein
MSISTTLVRVIVDAVERTGVPWDEFLRSVKIAPARLSEVAGGLAALHRSPTRRTLSGSRCFWWD